MFNRLKHGFFLSSSEPQRLLHKAKVDKSHDLIANRHLTQLSLLLRDNRSKNQLINQLYRKMHSQNTTLRIKSLVVMHCCLRSKFDPDLMEVIDKEQVKPAASKSELDSYLEENTINFYIYYLKKICIDQESYQFVRSFSYTEQLAKDRKVLMVSHGFKIVNLMNFILQSQEMFNKMGRYHLTHNELINMYLQLLQDLDYFNLYLKKSIGVILRCLKDNLQNTQSLNNIPIANQKMDQQTKHSFLYINQAQKISDRLYQFYHNRYYYKTIRTMITFPSFLQINSSDYKKVKGQAKLVDRNLVKMVKLSKYDNRYCTQGNINKTYSYDKSFTQFGEYETQMNTTNGNCAKRGKKNEQVLAQFVEEGELELENQEINIGKCIKAQK